MAFGGFIEFAKCRAAAASEKVNRGVCGDSRQPMGRFVLVFELFLVLQGLDEGFLGEILGVGDVLDYMIDLPEDPPEVLGNKTVLSFLELQAWLDDVAHANQYGGSHRSLHT